MAVTLLQWVSSFDSNNLNDIDLDYTEYSRPISDQFFDDVNPLVGPLMMGYHDSYVIALG